MAKARQPQPRGRAEPVSGAGLRRRRQRLRPRRMSWPKLLRLRSWLVGLLHLKWSDPNLTECPIWRSSLAHSVESMFATFYSIAK